MSKEVSNYQSYTASPTTTTATTGSGFIGVGESGRIYTTNPWFNNIQNWAIGFERQWDLLEQLRTTVPTGSSYPPYNIIKVDDNEYKIEMALAGFNKKEIEVVQQEQTLTVTGNKVKEIKETYIHKGIGARSFTHTFALSDYVQVDKADFTDGILTITLLREVPEDKKPRTITVK